jgi:hypothetical protein
MKRNVSILTAAVLAGMATMVCGMGAKPSSSPNGGGQQAQAATSGKGFPGLWIYSDDRNTKNRYAPSGWMGDHAGLKMDTASPDNPKSGKTTLKFSYKPTGPDKWVGVFWQDPANNWGERDGGYDLSGAKRLSFYARGAQGGEVLKEIKVGGIKGKFADSDEVPGGPIRLTDKWAHYTVELKGRNLAAISGGFCWVATAQDNPKGLTFYLDDIHFE